MLFFEFPEDARWSDERDAVEFSVGNRQPYLRYHNFRYVATNSLVNGFDKRKEAKSG
jgi:hypothetical protein